MSINISSNFDLFAALPLDARTVASDITARDAIDSGQRYEGLWCYVVDSDGGGTPATYQLQNGITNGDWVLVGSGAGITGSGSADSIALWSSGTNLSANIFFTRNPLTSIVNNSQGFSVDLSATTVTRYVDPVGGSNLNDGLTNLSAWADINFALSQCPKLATGIYQIEVAAGVHTQNIIIPEMIGNANSTDGNSVIYINGAGTGATTLTSATGFVVTSMNNNCVVYLDNLLILGDGDAITPATISGVRGSGSKVYFGDVNLYGLSLALSFSRTLFIWQEQTPAVVNTALDCDVIINSATGSTSIINKSVDMSFKTNGLATNSFGVIILDGTKDYSFTGVGPIANGALQPSGAFISVGAGTGTLDFDNVASPYRIINSGTLSIGGGHTITITDCSNGLGVLSENSYFVELSANTYVAAGTTPNQYTTNSNSFMWSPSAIFDTNTGWTRLNTLIAEEKFGADFRYLSYAKGEHVGAPTLGATEYFSQSGLVTTAVPLDIIDAPSHIQSLFVSSTVANGAAHSDTYTVTLNGAPTAVTVTITNGSSGVATGNVYATTGDIIGVEGQFDAATEAENIFVKVGIRRS